MQENKSKKSCNKQIVTNIINVSNDTTNVASNNITLKTLKQKENTKEQLGVTASIAIMEPETENQSSRAYKQPLRSCLSNKIKVLLDSGSDWRPLFPTKGKSQTLSLPD